MRRTIVTGMVAILAAACAGTPSGGPDTTGPPAAEAGTTAPTSEVGTPATTTAPPAGPVVGPVYTGDLVDAIPPVVGGQVVTVEGPIAADAEDLGMHGLLELIEALGLEPGEVELAYGFTEMEESVGLVILAVRLPGFDSGIIDSTFDSTQRQVANIGNFRVVSVAGRNVRAFDLVIGGSVAASYYAWVNGDILFWIWSDEELGQQAVASMPLPTVSLEPTGDAEPVEGGTTVGVEVTISGGEFAGSYSGSVSEGGCSRGATGENTFGLQYSTDEEGVDLSSVQLIVHDAAAAAGGTDDFSLTVTIGPPFDGYDYRINPAEGEGSGTLTLEDRGGSARSGSATIRVEGETADGIAIELTVECHSIFDFGG